MAFNTVRREAVIGAEPRYELPRFDTRDVAHAGTRWRPVRKVCVVIGSRANYGSIKSVMRAVQAHPDLHAADHRRRLGAARSLRIGRRRHRARRLHAGRARQHDRRGRDAGDDGQVNRARAAGAADAVRAAEAGRRGHRRRSLRDDGHGRRRRLHEHPARAHDGRRGDRHDRREHPARDHQARARALPGEPRSGGSHRPPRRGSRRRCTSSAARGSIWWRR